MQASCVVSPEKQAANGDHLANRVTEAASRIDRHTSRHSVNAHSQHPGLPAENDLDF
jgi:hypothetical protein